MNTSRIVRMVALLCAAGCVLVSTSDSAAIPPPLYILHAGLEPLMDRPAPGRGNAMFVAHFDKVNCGFSTFLTGVKPSSTMVVSLRRGKERIRLGWLTADATGRAVLDLSTYQGDHVPMCQVGDVVEIWAVPDNGPGNPTRPVRPYRYNLILLGVLQ